MIERDKIAAISKYFSYFVFVLNIAVVLCFFGAAIFTENQLVFHDLARITVGFAILGIIVFIPSIKLNKAEPKSNLLLQSSYVLAYFFVLLEMTGRTDSFLFPLIFLFLIFSAFYSLIVSSVLLVISISYFVYSEVYLNGQTIQNFITLNGSYIFTLVAVTLFALFLGYKYRRSIAEKSKLETYTKNVSADKSKDEAIFSNIGDGIYAVNTKREMILFNPQAEKITGWKSEDAVGLPCKKIMNLKNEQSISICEKDCPALAVWNTGENIIRDDLCFFGKGKGDTRLEGTYAPIKDMEGKVTGAICVFRDITKKKEVERMRSEFVSTASHELRTPITAMSGYIELVMNQNVCQVDDKGREYLKKAFDTANAMSNLIKNLLAVTKIEDRKIEYTITNFPLKELAEEVIEVFQNKAKEKGIELKFNPSPNMTVKGKVVGRSLDVRADKEQIREVFNNLIENALKFTSKGGVTVSITYDDDFATVCIADTGVGIPEDGQKHLFEKFYQVDNSATRQVGGTGLGLYITRSIIETFGGKIWTESKEGKGSKFFFTIPRALD
ncbi:PAS domain S-box protein [candidate division WS5 bacterium]|uniref:histidine kinase n=1 Tax=candidate division WS5 bacterium TaxID=2093353 RepID=A0A419DA29_9BACT|nr:MAG: PAS domain S-box protein [candidate division WS5 bacterium]